MSLINEALKKAQQLRAAEAEPTASAAGPRLTVPTRKAPRSARAVALLTFGLGFVVMSGALLAYYFFVTPASTVVMAPSRPRPVSPATTVASVPAVGGEILPPNVEPNPSGSTAPSASLGTGVAATPLSTPVDRGPDSALVHSPSPPQAHREEITLKANEQIQAFVESMHVMGIRAAGDDSRALINGRHYRINDVVERNLGVRLVKVEATRVTFADQNGVLYLKTF